MLNQFKITYLFESITLWGGNKVALEHAEALSRVGHTVTILSKDSGPTWYSLSLPVIQVSHFDHTTIPESDIIVGTYWTTVKAAYESRKGSPVHLCQGYEGDYRELSHFKAAIDEVYSLKIPKLTVSPHLNRFLFERFHSETYYIGQMINGDIFFPSRRAKKKWFNPLKRIWPNTLKILIVGPFEVYFKNIPTALRGISSARKRFKIPIKLIRVSQFSLSRKEEEIIKPDIYHFHVPHQTMGDIYRGADLFISMSKEAEGFGLPALEAMACGVPTILSRISSYCSFDEPPDYALFVGQPESESVADAIQKIYHDNELRERLIQRGLEVSNNFTPENVLFRLQNAFTIILDKNTRSDTI